MLGKQLSRKKMGDVLDKHAETLITGDDNGDTLLDQHQTDAPRLEKFFSLADRVYEKMTPVEPAPEFLADLKGKLHELQEAQNASKRAWFRRSLDAQQKSSLLGKIISVLAVTALLIRLVGSVMIIVAFIIGIGRRRRAAAA